MSLLMQALKKAEHAKKHQSGEPDKPAPVEATIAPTPAEKPAYQELSLSAKDDDFAKPIAAPARPDTDLDFPKIFENAAPRQEISLSPQFEAFAIPPLAVAPVPAGRAADEPNRSTLPTLQDIPAGLENSAPIQPTEPAIEPARAVVPESRAATIPAAELPRQAEPASASLARPALPKISPEQQKSAQQEEKKIAADQQKAKVVFAAKQPAKKKRGLLLAGIAVAVLALAGGGAYFYWQLSLLDSGPPIARVQSRPITPAPQATTPTNTKTLGAASESASAAAAAVQVAQALAPVSLPPTSAAGAGKPIADAGAAPARPVSAPSAAAAVTVAQAKSASGPATAMIMPAKPVAGAPNEPAKQAPDSAAIQVRQTISGDQVNPALQAAYQSFISGDARTAQQQYQKVLQQEPANRDALLGLAAIALNRRQPELAGSFYAKLLELDPGDPEAIAGLSSLQQGDPVQSESRLKKILQQSPQSGPILFALGNLYAQQSRWADAQQTYFRAYTSAPSNPDYAFNLAVSLDRLSQGKLAQDFYQRALTLGQSSPGNFNRSAVQNRIRELQVAGGN
jgi:Flp pilus assembly protein TadD